MENKIITSAEQELLDYLRKALPLADQIALTDAQLLRVVRHALKVRSEVPWGADIPESVFRAFVVFPRVNNENPVFYHGTLWEILKPRIEGKSLYEAVLEINYWSCEVATYQLTDGRTANALTVLPDDKRDIVLLAYFLDMTDQEIADKLDMVRRTVQYKRAQSLKELKKEMEVTEDGAQSE